MALGRLFSVLALVCTWLSASVGPSHAAKDNTPQTASGLPVPRVAAHFERSVHATETLLTRARAALRRVYREAGDPDA